MQTNTVKHHYLVMKYKNCLYVVSHSLMPDFRQIYVTSTRQDVFLSELMQEMFF